MVYRPLRPDTLGDPFGFGGTACQSVPGKFFHLPALGIIRKFRIVRVLISVVEGAAPTGVGCGAQMRADERAD